MKIIISPAKKMKMEEVMEWKDKPVYLDEAGVILEYLRSLSHEELKALWGCNDKIAAVNFQRLESMRFDGDLSPAILSYEGIQYQYMAPGVFESSSYEWIQENLRILSGFYGILKPMDGIMPYRLEMQAKASVGGASDLYDFWGDKLYRALVGTGAAGEDSAAGENDAAQTGDHVILNLASKEYSKTIEKYLTPDDTFITCIFAEEVDGKAGKGSKLVQKGTLAKMARGEMVRYLAEIQAAGPEDVKGFDRLGYRFRAEKSSETEYVFVKE